jgi:hypothetical protein
MRKEQPALVTNQNIRKVQDRLVYLDEVLGEGMYGRVVLASNIETEAERREREKSF